MDKLVFRLFSAIDISESDLNIPKGDPSSAKNVMELVFVVVGAASLIIMIVSGIRFILSQGDPEKSKKARYSVIYAAVGLGLATVAFTIVSFFVGTVK